MRRPTLYSSAPRSGSVPGSARATGAARPAGSLPPGGPVRTAGDPPPGRADGTQALPNAEPSSPQATARPAAAGRSPQGTNRQPDAATTPSAPRRQRWPALGRQRVLLPALGASGALVGAMLYALLAPAPPLPLQQEEIDAAVLRTLERKPLPSFATRAVEAVRPSVVRVRRLGEVEGKADPTETGVGTGVVILDTGVILTNLHVVAGAERIGVVFADGSESEAVVLSVQPEHDLAVIRARSIPDDLVAATLRSTQDLAPGDAVAAVGFPFGIGPSATAGVVSGLRRDYLSPQGKRILTNLIQFDAAVNAGNSGGPLVTADGEVVGIVTGLLNPTDQGVFIGIGFAVPIENAASAVGMSPF